MPTEVSPLVLAVVAGGFTTFGVVLKIAYDSVTAWRTGRKERLDRFATERREAYESFLSVVRQMRQYHNAMNRLIEEHRQGKTEILEEEQATFPHSSMAELATAQERVRRLARNYALITAADAIVQLFTDMTAAERAALESPSPNDEIMWFLLQRFLDDRILEFTHGYREDLGLGHPKGAPKNYPIVNRERPVPLGQSELFVRGSIPRNPKASPAPDAQIHDYGG